MSGASIQAGPAERPDDELTLLVGGQRFGGWQGVEVTQGIEIMPSHFDVTLTERFPGEVDEIVIQPDQAVGVEAGNDRLLTGVIDRYVPSFGPRGHQVRIMGRGRCRELADCSAGILAPGDFSGMQFQGGTATSIARALARPFGIGVTLAGIENDLPIGPFRVTFGETPYQVIDRYCRYRGLLAYEDTNGDLVLAGVGTAQMATGFAAPGNATSASAEFSCDERFTHFYVARSNTDTAMNGASSANLIAAQVVDPNPASGFRPKAIVSEQDIPELHTAERRAAWEMNRANGRSCAVTLSCDSWRDGAGALWAPNRLAMVDIPACKVRRQTMLIAQVTFRKGSAGTTADLTLMPPDAFLPQPSLLAGLDYQLLVALQNAAKNRSGGAAADPPPASAPRIGASDLSGSGANLA